jgi:glycosyltransferase involved in cell wall biosynthesis
MMPKHADNTLMQISVVIITFNEERNIGRCLASVKTIADEIILLDSFSNDDTITIAKSYGAVVHQQKFAGHIEQKNAAIKFAKYDWILALDADEALDETLIEAIAKVKQKGPERNIVAYKMNRLTNYCGHWIWHSGWYPDTKTRLFEKSKGQWGGENPHDRWDTHEARAAQLKLKGNILHYSFYTLSEHLNKIERYTEIAARQRIQKGKKYSLLKIYTVPLWVFILNYFIRLGILDGYYGYIVCKLQAFETWVKYNKVRIYGKERIGN